MRWAYLVALIFAAACARSPIEDGEARLVDSAGDSGGDGSVENSASGASPNSGSSNLGQDGTGGSSGGASSAGASSGATGSSSSTGATSGSTSAASGGNQNNGSEAGTCANTASDPLNCGRCGRACPASATSCVSGLCQFSGCTWREFAGEPYLFCNSKQGQTWAASRAFCQALNMDLTVLETTGEDAFVALNVIDHWIGASDLDTEGEWRWIVPGGATKGALFWQGKADGTVQSGAFTNWFSFDPNDANGGEDCARLLSSDWWDEPCTGDKGLVCEVVRTVP